MCCSHREVSTKMPTIGPVELIIILVIALLVLGPGRLPDVGAALGKSIREFRKAASDVQDSVKLDTAASRSQAVATPAATEAAPPPSGAAPTPTGAPAPLPDAGAALPTAEAEPAASGSDRTA
jgi:sec-independent protein translocase protein TatA